MFDLIRAVAEKRADLAELTRMAHRGDSSLLKTLESLGISSPVRREQLRAELRRLPAPGKVQLVERGERDSSMPKTTVELAHTPPGQAMGDDDPSKSPPKGAHPWETHLEAVCDSSLVLLCLLISVATSLYSPRSPRDCDTTSPVALPTPSV